MSYWYEVIFVILAWAVQIGCILLLAALLTAVVVWGGELLIRKKRGRFLSRFLIAALLICAVLAAFAVSPPVVCAEHCRGDLTEEWKDAVRSVNTGLYSAKLPLIPLCVRVTDIEAFATNGGMEHRITFDVYYFCAGREGMEYSTRDGFNITKPLF